MTVGDDIACPNPLPQRHLRQETEAGALVRLHQVRQFVDVQLPVVLALDADFGRRDILDSPVGARGNQALRVLGGDALDARMHQRCFGVNQRHALTLHVGAHQRAPCVVVFQKRDHRRGGGEHLCGVNIHVLHLLTRHDGVFVAPAYLHCFGQLAVLADGGVGGRDVRALVLVGRQVDHLVGHLAVHHFAVGCAQKPNSST